MHFGLDYDGTFTADPELWLLFILMAQHHEHTVTVVTMRYDTETEDVDKRLEALGVRVVYTDRMAKAAAVKKLGLDIHVWIDDHPQAVHLDAAQIWDTPSPRGKPVIPEYTT